MWVVLNLHMKGNMNTPLGEQEIPMVWAHGMVGVLPVFDTEEGAKQYANGACGIVELRVNGPLSITKVRGLLVNTDVCAEHEV